MNKLKSLCANLFVSILTFVIMFFVLELGARIYINNFADEQAFKQYASLKQIQRKEQQIIYTPRPYIRYFPTPGYKRGKNRHNALGYRGDEIMVPKPEGQFRIVCIGGSTTYTTAIDDYKMSYPYLLNNKLQEKGYQNVNVINSGTGGWTSWESLINFELRTLDLEPDLIIINHAINDIHARLIWPPEAYKSDNSGMYPTTSYIVMPGILEYSTFLRIFMIKAGITRSHTALEKYGKMSDDVKITDYVGEFKKQKRENKYPQGIFKDVSAMEMLKTNRPIYYKRNITNMVLIAKSRGIKTILASFAYSPLFNDPMVSSEEYIFAYDEMSTVLRNISDEMNVYFFDFKKLFPEDRHYYVDGRHVNEEGVMLKAELFANFLIENKLVPLQ